MSGFYIILYSLFVCDSVELYGFTPYRDQDKNAALHTQYHYFDSAIPRAGSHSFDLTLYIYKALSRKYNLTVYG